MNYVDPNKQRATALEIAFANKALRQLCENKAKAICDLGQITAAKLRSRLADIREASSVADLAAGNPRELDSNGFHLTLDLRSGRQLVISANHNVNPTLGSGHIDWQKVARVKIERITESHD